MPAHLQPRARRQRSAARMRRIEHWFDLFSAIDAAPSTVAALHVVATGIAARVPVVRSTAIVFDLTQGPQCASDPATASTALVHALLDTPLAEQILWEQQPLIVDDTQMCAADLGTLQATPASVLLMIPIVLRNDVIGVVSVERGRAHPWHADEIRIISHVAVRLAHTIDRLRLVQALEHRTQELDAVAQTTLAISSQIDLPTTLNTIIEQAAELVHADSGALYLCDDTYGELEMVVSYRLDTDHRGTRLKLGEGLTGRAALSRHVEHVNDYMQWTGRSPQFVAMQFQAVLAVPLLQDDLLLGVITVAHRAAGARFNEADIAIVQRFAAQAVIALDNARLYDQAHQYALRMSALAHASQLLDAQGDMLASLRPLASEGMAVLGAQACLLMLSDTPQSAYDVYFNGITEAQAMLFRECMRLMPAQDGRRNDVLLIQHTAAHAPNLPISKVAQEAGFQSAIVLPLLRDDQPIGGITYFYTQPQVWNPDEIELARVVANQMAAMAANVLLYHQVHEANRLKAEFVSTVSHELRTPMGAIIGYTELLQSGLYGSVPQPMLEPLRRVKTNADHLLMLINQMLDLSRIEAQRLELHEEPYDPRDLILSVRAMMSPLTLTKQLDLQTLVDDDVPHIVLGDVSRLKQILINLIGNSVKFTQRGVINVGCSIDQTGDIPLLHFVVRDTGMGIAEDQLALIWEPFRQGDSSTTREFGGTGLGLTIVRDLTRLMGGSATVSSRLREGSTFQISLPLHVPRSAS